MIDPTVTPPTPDPSLLTIDVFAVYEQDAIALLVYRLPDVSAPIAEVGTDYNSYVISDSFLLQPGDYVFMVRYEWLGILHSPLSLEVNEMEYACRTLPCVNSLSISASGIQEYTGSTVGLFYCETGVCMIYKDNSTEPFLSLSESDGRKMMVIEPGFYSAGKGVIEVVVKNVDFSLDEGWFGFSLRNDGSIHFECPNGYAEVTFTHTRSELGPESFTLQQNGETKKSFESSMFEKTVYTYCLLPGEYSLSLNDFSSSSSVTVQQCGSSLGSFTSQDPSPSFTVSTDCQPVVCDEDNVLVSIAAGSCPRLILAEYSPRNEVFIAFDNHMPEVHLCLKKNSLFFIRESSYWQSSGVFIHVTGLNEMGGYVNEYEELWFSTSEGKVDPPSDYHGRFVFDSPSQFDSIPSDVEVIVGLFIDCDGEPLPTLDFSSFAKLQLLTLREICSSTTSIVISGLNHLKSIEIHGRYDSDIPLNSLMIKNCPYLTHLEIYRVHYCSSVEIDGTLHSSYSQIGVPVLGNVDIDSSLNRMESGRMIR